MFKNSAILSIFSLLPVCGTDVISQLPVPVTMSASCSHNSQSSQALTFPELSARVNSFKIYLGHVSFFFLIFN